MPMFMLAIGFVALLVTYPFGTLTGACLVYLATIPVSWRRFGQMLAPAPPAPAEEPEQTRRGGSSPSARAIRGRVDSGQ